MTLLSARKSYLDRSSAFEEIGDLAVSSLKLEVATYPKPGLVSHVDSGAHADMDAALLLRSADTLRPWFVELAAAGAAGAGMDRLRVIGITGTSGKTTTTYLVEAGLRAAGRVAGLIGTVGIRIDGRDLPSSLTTPGAPDGAPPQGGAAGGRAEPGPRRLLDRLLG